MLMDRSSQSTGSASMYDTDLRKMGEVSVIQIFVEDRHRLVRGHSDQIDFRGDREGLRHLDLSASRVVPLHGSRLSPTVVAGALKGAIFAANVYEKLGFGVVPNGTESRHDIIQAITFGTPEGVIKFCEGIQAAAPVDSFVTPEPWAMPGYDSDVIMAAGAFVQGSSIELSADGPIKPPYAVYFQGGLTWFHAKLGILMSLQKLVDAGIVTL